MIVDRILSEKLIKIIVRVLNKIFILFVVGLIFWFYGLNNFVKNLPQEVKDVDTKTDAIVVLTGGSDRIEIGLMLLSANQAEKLFVSGVGEGVSLLSLLSSSSYVPESMPELAKQIKLGYEAKNTKGNADEVYDWVKENDIKSLRLVTSNYHMPRSLIEFEDKMPEIKIIPHPVKPYAVKFDNWNRNPPVRKLLMSEYNKYLITKLRVLF
jgi:uncharacterized SAM-binding protein YcdF (DUF218 family)